MADRPSVKRTKIDMTSLKIYIRGEKKTGKTTSYEDESVVVLYVPKGSAAAYRRSVWGCFRNIEEYK